MSRTLTILGGLAAVQFALVGITWWPSAATVHEAHTLVALDGITRITVTGRAQPGEPAAPPLVLEKEGSDWLIRSAHDYPADPEKVTAVLDKLAALEVRAPVATQATSHGSLNVADTDHARTVTLSTGSEEATLVLGSASGTAAHVRLADEASVYTVRGWTAFSVSDQAKQYWDTSLLQLDPATVDSLTVSRPDGSGFTLKKTAEGWSPAGEQLDLDEAAIDAHLKRLANLKIADVLGKGAGPSPEHATRVEWTTTGETDGRGGVLFGADTGEGNTITAVDGSPWGVTAPTSSLRAWHTLTVDDLVFVDALEEMPDLPGGPHGGPPKHGGGPPHGAPPH